MAHLKNLLTGLLMGTIIAAALYVPLIIDLGAY